MGFIMSFIYEDDIRDLGKNESKSPLTPYRPITQYAQLFIETQSDQD